MSFSLFLMFSVTVFVASILPGPSMLLALTHGIQHGARRATASAMGNVTVTLLQASISIVGLGTVLLASETFFQVIKWMGAAYLVYMGVCIIISPSMALSFNDLKPTETRTSLRKMYLQAAFVTAGNPKAIVFFGAVFPQFIDQNANFLVQSCLLLGVSGVISYINFMLYAMGGQKIAALFSKATQGRLITRIIGGTFIGAGAGLALSKR